MKKTCTLLAMLLALGIVVPHAWAETHKSSKGSNLIAEGDEDEDEGEGEDENKGNHGEERANLNFGKFVSNNF